MKRPKFKAFSDWILFENEECLVVNKPSGISSLEERDGESLNVLFLAKKHLGSQVSLCHRLDKETSGALIIAKNPEAYRHIALQFQKRTVFKVYHAVTNGRHDFEQTKIELPLSVNSKSKAFVDHKSGKKAITEVNTIEKFGHYTLVSCILHSGRFHQIRVHLASVNAALAADEKYGGEIPYLSNIMRGYKPGKKGEPSPMIYRTALHAYTIGFTTLSGNDVLVNAPYAKDFETLLKMLRRYDGLKVS